MKASVIPGKIRKVLELDPFMKRCFRHGEGDCAGCVEWEHAWMYAGRKIQERWAIVPACKSQHHQGPKLDKNLNRYAAILRMTPEEWNETQRRYPRIDWEQQKNWLASKFPEFSLPDMGISK